MAYTKNTWVDRVVQYPNRYKDQSNNQYTFTRDNGTITSEGTVFNASKMNNIENGIYSLDWHLTDQTKWSVYKTGQDEYGIYTTVTLKRSDGTKIMTSVLSGGTSPLYTTRTETYYALNGTTVEQTIVYTRTYSDDESLATEVIN